MKVTILLWPVVGVLAATMAVLGGGWPFRPKRVVGVAVIRGPAIEAIYATGTVESRVRTKVRARSTGEIVVLTAREGDLVERGQVLARLDTPRVASLVQRERATLSEARVQASDDSPALATLRHRRAAAASELLREGTELARIQRLYESSSVTELELTRAQRRVETLQKRVAELDSESRSKELELRTAAKRQATEVDEAEAMAADLIVRAPMDGIVLERLAEVGEYALVGETLFVVGSRPPYVIEVQVDEEDVARIRAPNRPEEQPTRAVATIRGLESGSFNGAVERIAADADRQQGTFVVRVALEEPPFGLRSGMACEVNLVTREQPDAVLAPSAAVVANTAWIARNGRAHRVPVQIGVRGPAWVSIDGGLSLGDVALVSGTESLGEGESVDVQIDAMPIPPHSGIASALRER